MSIDVEIIVRPIPFTGLARHLGGEHPAEGIRDNQAIASALREIADILDSKPPVTQNITHET